MDKPTDYPLHSDTTESDSDTHATEFTYAVLKDRVEAKQPITDEMIAIARIKLETAQTSTVPTQAQAEHVKLTLNNLRNRFRIG